MLVATVVFLIILIHNPKRRFLRAAWYALGVGIFNITPFATITFEVIKEFLNKGFQIQLHSVTPSSPWLNAMLFILAGFLFLLDHKQK